MKGAFKEVTKEIKALSDTQLSDFLVNGTIEVLGHTLGPDDLRIMYSFDGNNDKYEAHSEGDMLVLLDCSPDQVGLFSNFCINPFISIFSIFHLVKY